MKKLGRRSFITISITTIVVLALLTACKKTVPLASIATIQPPTLPAGSASLTQDEAATLNSLEQIDDYPLYTMRYYGDYKQVTGDERAQWWGDPDQMTRRPGWGCSLFAALGNPDAMLYGRNFDWQYSPAVLLFTDPTNGYASVSMVDIAYLGFAGDQAKTLTDLPLSERRSLLDAPYLPFDGMNERGLAVGMAAVPLGQMLPDPNKKTLDSLMVIRQVLDHAGSVDEAVTILQSYNIDWGSGPPLHYLVADSAGRAALIEFYQGQMVIIPNETPWQLATNFIRASVGESVEGTCWRYDKISQQLAESEGKLTAPTAMSLLSAVAQESTQWSIVYQINTGNINVAMNRQYNQVHTLHLEKEAKQ